MGRGTRKYKGLGNTRDEGQGTRDRGRGNTRDEGQGTSDTANTIKCAQ